MLGSLGSTRKGRDILPLAFPLPPEGERKTNVVVPTCYPPAGCNEEPGPSDALLGKEGTGRKPLNPAPKEYKRLLLCLKASWKDGLNLGFLSFLF